VKFALLLLPGGSFLLLAWWLLTRTADADRVSERWLAEQDQREEKSGIEGVSWRFPINKIVNEHGAFNAARLRKRA
jgi:hypothetical protein